MQRLSNPIRDYSWGGTSAIAELLGIPDDGEPKAELWLGAHPDSPSVLADGRRLDDVVGSDPDHMLGEDAERRFGARLPYLVKFLSAAEPLSLQVHPDPDQAEAGFADEEASSVPRDAAERRYRDPFHKPEMVVALEPFDALCGLRDPAQTLTLLRSLDVDHDAWQHLLGLLEGADPTEALRAAVSWLLSGDEHIPELAHAVGGAAADQPERPEFATTAALAEAYPGDPGVLVALLLNRVRLGPGDALFLPPGNMHAYLRGTAIEVMASSDNVLRAGLTPKHVDAAELMRITDFAPHPIPWVTPAYQGPVAVYRPDVAEFELAMVNLRAGVDDRWHDVPVSGPRILLVLDGELQVAVSATPSTTDGGRVESVARGTSYFLPAASGRVRLRGSGSAVVAGVPAHPGNGRPAAATTA